MFVKFDAIDWIELQQNEFRLIMDSSSMYVHLYHPTGVVCDFGNVEYVGSTTLEALIRFSRRHRSIRMAVVTGSDAIIEVLSITSLDRIFAVYRDFDDAIEHLVNRHET